MRQWLSPGASGERTDGVELILLWMRPDPVSTATNHRPHREGRWRPGVVTRLGRGGSMGCGACQHPAEIDRGSASQVLGSRSFPRRSPKQQDTRGEQRTRQRESRLQRWVDHPENLVGSQHHPSRRETPDPVDRQHGPGPPSPRIVRNVTCHVGS